MLTSSTLSAMLMLTLVTFRRIGGEMIKMFKRLWQTEPRSPSPDCLMLAVLAGAARRAGGRSADRSPAHPPGSSRRSSPCRSRIYTFTLAWIFTFIPEWARTRRIVGWTTAIALVLEMVIIGLPGGARHDEPLQRRDAARRRALCTIMGLAIVAQTLTSIAVAVALWRQRFRGSRARLGAAARHDASRSSARSPAG